MGLLKIYADVRNHRLVKGLGSAEAYTLPRLVYGDKLSLELCLLEPDPIGGQQRPFALVDTSPYSLKIGIGPRASTPYSLQDTWAKYTGDAARWTGYLDLGSTNMGTAIGTDVNIKGVFEIEINSVEGGYETIVQQDVDIWNQVIAGGVASPLPLDEYFTKAEQAAIFVAYQLSAGQTITIPSANGLYARQIGCNDDGTAMDNIITL